jgi:hypothetical protein
MTRTEFKRKFSGVKDFSSEEKDGVKNILSRSGPPPGAVWGPHSGGPPLGWLLGEGSKNKRPLCLIEFAELDAHN